MRSLPEQLDEAMNLERSKLFKPFSVAAVNPCGYVAD
jgi:hypothetical protein